MPCPKHEDFKQFALLMLQCHLGLCIKLALKDFILIRLSVYILHAKYNEESHHCKPMVLGLLMSALAF